MTDTLIYIKPLLTSVVLAAALTPQVKKLAFRLGAVDHPGDARRIHQRPTARLGGLAIYLSIVITALIYGDINRQLLGLIAAITVLMLVGVADDIKGLSATHKLIWQIIAAGIALAGGIGIVALSDPFGGILNLSWGRFLVNFGPLHFHVMPIANTLSILWMVGIVNVINFLDGLDGLATGVSSIAALALFVLSIKVHQPATAMLALIVAGSSLGFLPYNFNPASIFLGDSGAYTLGLMLAMIAIYSGSKLATAALVLGFPILDGVWTVIRRVLRGISPFAADRGHLHHLMLDVGMMSQKKAVLTLYGLAAIYGAIAVSSNSRLKLVAFVSLTLIMALMLAILASRTGKKHKR